MRRQGAWTNSDSDWRPFLSFREWCHVQIARSLASLRMTSRISEGISKQRECYVCFTKRSEAEFMQ